MMMTRKAHSLGMSRSNFVNASGLPDDMQLTTARDLATLGRAIHDHYPQYFHYFSTPSFTYAGHFMANHNHLMEQVEGMDGIKTGYTNASGFNLLSSVNRNGHWLISVVLGGKTRLGRDHIMADLIASEIDKCATYRTAPMIAEDPALEHVAEAVPVVTHEGDAAPPVEGVDDEDTFEHPPEVAPRATVAEAEPETAPAPAVEPDMPTEAAPEHRPAACASPAPGGEGRRGARPKASRTAGLRLEHPDAAWARHAVDRLDPPAPAAARRLDLALRRRGYRDALAQPAPREGRRSGTRQADQGRKPGIRSAAALRTTGGHSQRLDDPDRRARQRRQSKRPAHPRQGREPWRAGTRTSFHRESPEGRRDALPRPLCRA